MYISSLQWQKSRFPCSNGNRRLDNVHLIRVTDSLNIPVVLPLWQCKFVVQGESPLVVLGTWHAFAVNLSCCSGCWWVVILIVFVAVNGASRFVLAKNRGELFSLVVSWELCYVFLVHFPLKQLGQFLFYISCCKKKKVAKLFPSLWKKKHNKPSKSLILCWNNITYDLENTWKNKQETEEQNGAGDCSCRQKKREY